MKKTLLAAAVIASFASVAHAETSVTLYGIVDAGIGYEKVKGTVNNVDVGGSRTGMISGLNSANRWGIKGTEDLGEGLKAVFQLESGFNLGTGATTQTGFFGRQATLGLQSDAWGRLDLGRQTNIASKYFATIASPFGVDFGQSKAGTVFGAADSVRYDNMVMYQTPNFSGFQFGVGYSFQASGDQKLKMSGANQPNSRAVTTGLRYANGPIAAAVTYDQLKTTQDLGLTDGGVSIKGWNLGASYDFEVVKVHAGFGQARNGWLSSLENVGFSNPLAPTTFVANSGMKVNSYTVGLSAPVGANGKVLASWAMADARDGGVHLANADLAKENVYSLGYTHSLSKRTNLYAIGSYAKHVAFQRDLKSTLVSVGMRHQF